MFRHVYSYHAHAFFSLSPLPAVAPYTLLLKENTLTLLSPLRTGWRDKLSRQWEKGEKKRRGKEGGGCLLYLPVPGQQTAWYYYPSHGMHVVCWLHSQVFFFSIPQEEWEEGEDGGWMHGHGITCLVHAYLLIIWPPLHWRRWERKGTCTSCNMLLWWKRRQNGKWKHYYAWWKKKEEWWAWRRWRGDARIVAQCVAAPSLNSGIAIVDGDGDRDKWYMCFWKALFVDVILMFLLRRPLLSLAT